jgi:hydrogenase maturation protease
MPRILIVGYGNPLRSDDGVGWLAAKELAGRLSAADVEILVRAQLTPEIADDLQHCDTVIFVDASHDGEPGELTFQKITAKSQPPSFSHELSPAALLQLCGAIYGRYPVAFLVSLCGECFDHGEKLSSTVAASFPHLTALVTDLACGSPVRMDR